MTCKQKQAYRYYATALQGKVEGKGGNLIYIDNLKNASGLGSL